MTPQENLKLVKEYYNALNDHNSERASNYFAENASFLEASTISPIQGKNEIKNMLERGICGEFLKGFPDLRFELKDTIADENGVAVEWTLLGTHKGLFMGVQPTNKNIEIKGATIFQISDHKIVSACEYWNPTLLFNQIKAK